MTVLNMRVWFWMALFFMLVGCSRPQPAVQATPRTVSMSRVVRVPLIEQAQRATAEQGDRAKLAVFPGGNDELPEGPSGFDVTEDGTFLIADPLRNRIA